MKMNKCQFKRRRVRMRKDLEILVTILKKINQGLPKNRLLKKQMEMTGVLLVMMLTKENQSMINQSNKMKQEKRMILPNSTL